MPSGLLYGQEDEPVEREDRTACGSHETELVCQVLELCSVQDTTGGSPTEKSLGRSTGNVARTGEDGFLEQRCGEDEASHQNIAGSSSCEEKALVERNRQGEEVVSVQ